MEGRFKALPHQKDLGADLMLKVTETEMYLESPDLVRSLDAEFAHTGSPRKRIELLFSAIDPASAVVTTSGGIQSAALLLLVSEWCKAHPGSPQPLIALIDTGDLFAESIAYAQHLAGELELQIERVSHGFSRAEFDLHYQSLKRKGMSALDAFDEISKVVPVKALLERRDAKIWVAGSRRDQAPSRKNLPFVGFIGNRLRAYPLADFSWDQVFELIDQAEVSLHPLSAEYRSVGNRGESSPRTTISRWEKEGRHRGQKFECGLHQNIRNEQAQQWITERFGGLDSFPLRTWEDWSERFILLPEDMKRDGSTPR